MKKKSLLLIPLLVMSMTGCAPTEGEVTDNGLVRLCTHAVDDGYVTFVLDTYTDNIYMRYSKKFGYGFGLSPYYNGDGEIMKYPEFAEVHRH